MTKCAIGIDIGGTSVKLGLVDQKGKLLVKTSYPTSSSLTKEKSIDLLVEHIEKFKKEASHRKLLLQGVGVGAPGPIDVERGLVYFFPNIAGWKNTPLKKILEKKLRVPVALDNDASAMAYGEFLFGAGRGAKNIIALTLGTGVGGGIIMDGRLFHGPNYSAAEIGHLSINENGLKCGCGSRGCIETYVGNGYFVKEVKRRLDLGQKSILNQWINKDKKDLTPLLVAQAARVNDVLSIQMWKETAEHLGTALAGLVNILNPEKIILGGGIALNRELIFPTVIKTIKTKSFAVAHKSLKVVPAALSTDAGIIGAASLALANS